MGGSGRPQRGRETEGSVRALLLIFISLTCLSALLLGAWVRDLILVHKTLANIETNVREILIKLDRNQSGDVTGATVIAVIEIGNAGDVPLLVTRIFVDQSVGVHIDSKRLFYCVTQGIHPFKRIDPGSSAEFNITLRFEDGENPDLDILVEKLASGEVRWYIPIRGFFRVLFKEGLVDLSAYYSGGSII